MDDKTKALKAIALREWKNGMLIPLVDAALNGDDIEPFIYPKTWRKLNEK